MGAWLALVLLGAVRVLGDNAHHLLAKPPGLRGLVWSNPPTAGLRGGRAVARRKAAQSLACALPAGPLPSPHSQLSPRTDQPLQGILGMSPCQSPPGNIRQPFGAMHSGQQGPGCTRSSGLRGRSGSCEEPGWRQGQGLLQGAGVKSTEVRPARLCPSLAAVRGSVGPGGLPARSLMVPAHPACGRDLRAACSEGLSSRSQQAAPTQPTQLS